MFRFNTYLPLVLILVLAVLLRLPSLDHVLVLDEIHPARIIAFGGPTEIFFAHNSGHPPFYIWMNYLASLLLGEDARTYRMTSLIFSMLSLVLVYLIGKKDFDRRTAIIATVLMTVSAWFVIGSTQVHIDAPFLMFFYLVLVYTSLKYIETVQTGYLICLTVTFFLALLTKETALLAAPPLLLFFLCRRTPQFSHKQWLLIGGSLLIGVMLFAAFVTYAQHTSEDSSLRIVDLNELQDVYIRGRDSPKEYDIRLLLIQYGLATILATPLLLFLSVISLIRFNKKYVPYLVWVLVTFLFYTLFISGFARSFERWFIMFVPLLCITGGNVLAKMSFMQRDLLKLGCVITGALIVLIGLNMTNAETLAFYPKTAYYDRIVEFNWNMNMPVTGNAGPVGFYVSFSSIAIAFLSVLLILFVLVITRSLDYKALVIVALGISLASNLFLVEEHNFGFLNGNINKVSKEVIAWTRTPSLEEPVYVFRNFAIVGYYLKPVYKDTRHLDFDNENDLGKINEIKQTHGSVLVIDFPAINKKSDLWNMLRECLLLKTFYTKETPLGYVFDC